MKITGFEGDHLESICHIFHVSSDNVDNRCGNPMPRETYTTTQIRMLREQQNSMSGMKVGWPGVVEILRV